MRKISLLTILAATIGTGLISACDFSPEYKRPDMAMPGSWSKGDAANATSKAADSAATVVAIDWWKEFNDQNLTKLIEEGLAANADLQLAAERVSEARAALSLTNSNFLPTISGQASANRTRSSGSSRLGAITGGSIYNEFSVAAVLNYEVDLWGRLRNSSDSSKAQLLAVESNRDAVRLAVAAEIANGYFNLLSLDAQIATTENTIKGREENYRYQEVQFKFGAVNSLAFKQAESELAAAKAALPQLKQLRQEQESSLAILLGRSPYDIVQGSIKQTTALENIPVPPSIPSEVPSTLLSRRPDIQAAEQSLIAANADIGVARADYFPTLSLNALVGLTSADADKLLRSSARNWQGGGSLSGPIFDFGRVSSNVDIYKSRKEQAAIQYQQTVRVAFKDVIDAFSATQTTDERVKAQNAQTAAREETLKQSQLRYKAGYSNYLEVLDAQRFLYQAQLERIVAERDRLTSFVNLYKALGGGWSNDGKPPLVHESKPEIAPAAAVTAESKPAEPAPAVTPPVQKPEAEIKAAQPVEPLNKPEVPEAKAEAVEPVVSVVPEPKVEHTAEPILEGQKRPSKILKGKKTRPSALALKPVPGEAAPVEPAKSVKAEEAPAANITEPQVEEKTIDNGQVVDESISEKASAKTVSEATAEATVETTSAVTDQENEAFKKALDDASLPVQDVPVALYTPTKPVTEPVKPAAEKQVKTVEEKVSVKNPFPPTMPTKDLKVESLTKDSAPSAEIVPSTTTDNASKN